MKKTLIALAVAAVAATSANATVIYQKDGTKIDLDGRAHFEIRNEKNKRTDLRDVGSRVRVRAYHEIGNGFSLYGGVELRFSKSAQSGDADQVGSDLRTHRLYAGIIHKDIGTLTFGRQLHLGDHIPKANYSYEWGGNVLFDGHKKAAHFMSAKFAGFRFAADYYFGNANKSNSSGYNASLDPKTGLPKAKTNWDEGKGYGVGLFYDGKWDKLALRFGSGYTEVTQTNTGLKEDEYKLVRAGVGFDVTYDIFTVGFDWAHGKVKKDGVESGNLVFQNITGGAGFHKIDRYLVGAKVQVTPQNKVYAGYYFGTGKKVADDDVKMRGWMIGADHQFSKQVAVYVEGGQGHLKQDGEKILKNHRVLVGARILF